MTVVKNISKSFGTHLVLNDITIEIENRGVTAISGRSGCGKTTLFSIILGILKQDSGTVCLDGKKVRAVFQEDRLLGHKNPVDNLVFVGADKSKAEEILIKFGLQSSLKMPCSKLSGGMKRRVAFARALISAPDILLLDEPFNALDDNTKALMINETAEYAKEHPVMIITHIEEEIAALNAKVIKIG